MTDRPDPHTSDDGLLIDAIQGALDPAQAEALEARMRREPALAARHAMWRGLARSEREAFEAPVATMQPEAVRMAAWVRATVHDEEAVRVVRRRVDRAPARGWTRILAWSVAAHVVVLGVLAFLLQGDPTPTRAGGASIGLVDTAFDTDDLGDEVEYGRNVAYYESLVHRDLGARFDELAMIEQEDLGDLSEDLEGLLREEPVAWGDRAHPVGVVVPMTRRRVDGLKRRRMRLLGYNESGTIAAVDKGLRFLALRQEAGDGSFPGSDARGTGEQTALVLMTFLGEGHSSQGTRDRDAVVRRAVGYLRTTAFADTGDAPRVRPTAPRTLGPLTIALSEDYMLSYGALTLADAERRAAEIGALAGQVRNALAAPTAQDLPTRTWLLWALDATQRTGIVTATPEERSAFRSWVASSAAQGASQTAGSIDEALIAGTALLYAERGAAKPRFTSWSHANVEQLVDRLDPRGGARSGDPIGDTARILLALQVAYRTY